jgi:hypothetical protein
LETCTMVNSARRGDATRTGKALAAYPTSAWRIANVANKRLAIRLAVDRLACGSRFREVARDLLKGASRPCGTRSDGQTYHAPPHAAQAGPWLPRITVGHWLPASLPTPGDIGPVSFCRSGQESANQSLLATNRASLSPRGAWFLRRGLRQSSTVRLGLGR